MKSASRKGCIYDINEKKNLSVGAWISKEMLRCGLSSAQLATRIINKDIDNFPADDIEHVSTAFISNIKAGREKIPAHLVQQFLLAFDYQQDTIDYKHYLSEFARCHLPLELRQVATSPKRSISGIMEKEQKRVVCAHKLMQTKEYDEILFITENNFQIFKRFEERLINSGRQAYTNIQEKLKGLKEGLAKGYANEIKEVSITIELPEATILDFLTYENFEPNINFYGINALKGLGEIQKFGRFRRLINSISKKTNHLDCYDLTKQEIEASYIFLDEFCNSDLNRYKPYSAIIDTPIEQHLILSQAVNMDFTNDNFDSISPKYFNEDLKFLDTFNEKEKKLITDALSEIAQQASKEATTLPDAIEQFINKKKEISFSYLDLASQYTNLYDRPAELPSSFFMLYDVKREIYKLATDGISIRQEQTSKPDTIEQIIIKNPNISHQLFGVDISELERKSIFDKKALRENLFEKLILKRDDFQHYIKGIEYSNKEIISFIASKILTNKFNFDEILETEIIKKDDFGSFIINNIIDYL